MPDEEPQLRCESVSCRCAASWRARYMNRNHTPRDELLCGAHAAEVFAGHTKGAFFYRLMHFVEMRQPAANVLAA